MDLNKSTILLTGGTGSFGRTFVPMTLKKFPKVKIIVLSRDEMKQWEMRLDFIKEERLEFVIGDVRDKEKLFSVVRGIDCVVHAAATKIVPTAEENPDECIKTNIIGAMNLVDVCVAQSVKRVVALSTDKACNPINLYGATKLASDKLFLAANRHRASMGKTKFAVVRYGNVMGSRGSVIPFFMSLPKGKPVPITDTRMTRFMISLEQGVELVWQAFEQMYGGEIFVKKIPSMRVVDIANALMPDRKTIVVGKRAGEKLHEQMISAEDSNNTYEFEDFYKIIPAGDVPEKSEMIAGGMPVNESFVYSSDNNNDWMSIESLREWVLSNKGQIR